MTFQQKLIIITVLAALIGVAVLMRTPASTSSPGRVTSRFGGIVAAWLAVVAGALVVVGIVSDTFLRHVIQIVPLMVALGITGAAVRLGRECRRAALCLLVLGDVRDLAVPPRCGSDLHRNVYRRRNHAHGGDRCGLSVWPWHGFPKGTNHSLRGSARYDRCLCGPAIRGNVVERSALHHSPVVREARDAQLASSFGAYRAGLTAGAGAAYRVSSISRCSSACIF